MTLHFFNKVFILTFAALMIIAPAQAADKALSKSDVEQIVHDYIVANPEVVLNAVDDYQKKFMQERQNKALAQNKDILLKDTSSPETGNPEGDVTIIEFFDYNCHFCKSALTELQTLLEKDKKLRVILKDFPILGPTSETAAKWALAAQKQKKYFEYHKALMSNKAPITDDILEKLGKDVGLDIEQVKKDIAGTEIPQQIDKNRSLANSLGIRGTPAFIIGDEILPGALPASEIEKRIDAVRKAAEKKK